MGSTSLVFCAYFNGGTLRTIWGRVMSRKGLNNSLFYFSRKGNIRKNEKNKDCDESKVQNSITLGGTSRVVLELKPFGISIRGLIGANHGLDVVPTKWAEALLSRLLGHFKKRKKSHAVTGKTSRQFFKKAEEKPLKTREYANCMQLFHLLKQMLPPN